MDVLLPSGLDLEALVLRYPPDEVRPFKLDYLKYIVSLFVSIPARNKRLQFDDGSVPFYSVLLQSVIKNYNQYLMYLQRVEVVTLSRDYSIGNSRRYLLKNCGVYLAVDNLKDRTLVRRLTANDRERRKLAKKQYPYLFKWFDDKLTISESSFDQLERDRLEKTAHPELRDFNPKTKSHKDPQLQYRALLLNLRNLKSQEFYFSIDDTVGRVHTNLTNLKSSFRRYLRYDGQPLVSLDLKNSQPFLSLILFNPNFWTSKGCILGINNFNSESNIKYQSTINKIKEHSSYIMLGGLTEMYDNQDVKLYQKLVLSGELYQYFADKLSLSSDMVIRKQAKFELMRIFFSSNRFYHQVDARAKRVFAETFPTVFRVYNAIKVEKNFLACILQKIESYLMLDVVAKRISKSYPKAPLFTIHDSVVTTQMYKDEVSQIMADEITKFIGFEPTLSIEEWSE